MRRVLTPMPVVLLVGLLVAAIGAASFFAVTRTGAVQAPTISFDMVTTGNTYDETTNSMTLGPLDLCLETAAPGNDAQHTHTVHLVIQNVEDIVGWQARTNYTGDQFRPNTVNFTPFTDNNTGQNVSFLNLPIDSVDSLHRNLIAVTDIPPSAAGPQTALFGSTYLGDRTLAISPDTPPKAPPDDASYSAPAGGVLASVNVQVLAGQAGQVRTIDLDDSAPNNPGSSVVIFNGTTEQTIDLTEGAQGDAFHAEGTTCPAGLTPPGGVGATPTPTETPALGTPTPTPTGPGAGAGTPTPTATGAGAAGARTPTVTPRQLPATGTGGDGSEPWAYLVIIGSGVALSGAVTGFAISRARRNGPNA